MEITKQLHKNLSMAINTHIEFPKQVFWESWINFLFFDPDWVINPNFVEIAKLLLEIEGSHCAYIVDLDDDPNIKQHSFYFNKDTTIIDYQLVLGDKTMKAGGWIDNFSRYACISDIGQWCIYCERGSELAVIAFREHVSVEKYKVVIDKLKAVEISYGITTQHIYSLSESTFPKWREDLLEQYSKTKM